MKLFGSLTEQQYRKEMEKSHEAISADQRLLTALRKAFPQLKKAYGLSGHPEQNFYFFTLLINCAHIARVELDMSSPAVEPVVAVKSLSVFKKSLSKMHQIKLAVALDLAQKKLKDL